MKIVFNEEMRSLDQAATTEIGLPSLVLMENAGREAATVIVRRAQDHNYQGEVLVFCGSGKNGGDGLVVARHMGAQGHKVRVFLCTDPQSVKDETKTNLQILLNLKAKVTVVESVTVVEEYFNSAAGPFLAVDALLGTGLNREVDSLYYDVIECVNKYATEVISLDIPSGVNGDTGKIMGTSIHASMTVSFGYPKVGHFLYPGAARRGHFVNVDLGFPRKWADDGDKYLSTHENVTALMSGRDRYGHKNSFGHCLLVGGSPGRLGAIVMSSQACLKMGTGLVTVASWEDSFPALEMKLSPEVMTYRIRRDGGRIEDPADTFLSSYSSIVLGPGLSQREGGGELIKRMIEGYSGPLCIDADGLNLIAEMKLHELLMKRGAPTVLTPHPGEMARLLGITKEKVLEAPLEAVKKAAVLTGAVVVLKGATTLIHDDAGVTYFNHHPNDGMAKAGSGDVLAGMIGGLLGQGLSDLSAARLGVFAHSVAGRLAAEQLGERSMTATDIIHHIEGAHKELGSYQKERVCHACTELF